VLVAGSVALCELQFSRGGANVKHALVSPSALGLSGSTQRTVPRYTFVAVTEIIESTSQAFILAKTAKISRKGCYVETLNPLPVGTSLNMVISRDEGSFTTKGKVIYVHEGLDGLAVPRPDPRPIANPRPLAR
jgi:hypothetical protein